MLLKIRKRRSFAEMSKQKIKPYTGDWTLIDDSSEKFWGSLSATEPDKNAEFPKELSRECDKILTLIPENCDIEERLISELWQLIFYAAGNERTDVESFASKVKQTLQTLPDHENILSVFNNFLEFLMGGRV